MSNPIITSTVQGKLLGKILQNIEGNNFYGFQGIPYAKAPLNELRFKAPQAPEPWNGIRDATKEGSECYSRHMVFKNIIGSEDCLFLNVYTPHIPKENAASSLKPVMVWIHGGGFRHGSSKTDLYGPEYLLTEDIVLVSINYRLGIFGFLTFKDPILEVPGNAGLKDMIMALQWIQINISNFAGDPNNVTIFGESAGAAAVHYLILSPLAKGLFHKAILQSGCALNTFARGKNLSSEFADILKMTEINEKLILQHLMNLSVEELFELSEKVIDLHTDNYILREIIFAVKLHAKTSSNPIYVYRMSVDTKLNIFKQFGDIKSPGVAHGDDLGYLFKTNISPQLTPRSLEEKSVKIFVKYWTNFAKTGNPNSHDEDIIIHWKPVEKNRFNFIDIGEKLTTGVNPEENRLNFWSEIFSIKPSYIA